ncbi:extracellular solute-binding protein [Mesorhizobium sp.]|uniref:ABC transporter substrate-binding protein n=1 Tax=Mesorhizobium sp. TaxID=1871066 RepID=UPI000FE99C4C|nr:extracellular solute-binding protein [Mesorhizobium sp.]RWI66017.1 MAG: extracellular solute-binding protein [Mesorhizobium sp.]
MQLTRRKFLNTASMAAAAASTTVLSPFISKTAKAATELRVLVWESLAPDYIVEEFTKTTGVKVSRTYVSSNDEYMAKLAAGTVDYDLVDITSSLMQRAIQSNFIEPLDIAKIPNFKLLYPEFQNLSYFKDGDKNYGAPAFYGYLPLTLNADVIPTRNDFDILFDPAFKGKIAMWDDIAVIAQVAKWMGYKEPWKLGDDELAAVKAKLIEQKPLIRKYWTQSGEAIELFASGEIVASLSWSYVTQQLLKQGYNVRETLYPGALAWVDSYTIVKGTPNRDIAHQFINYSIAPETQAKFCTEQKYLVTTPEAKKHMDPEIWKVVGMDQVAERLSTTEFWSEVPRRSKYVEVWNEIKSA